MEFKCSFETLNVTLRAFVSSCEQRSKTRGQHSYWPCGRFPPGRQAALASDSSLEGLAAASRSQSILFYLEAFSSSPRGNPAAVWSRSSSLLRLVGCRALRDYSRAKEGKASEIHYFDFCFLLSFCHICHLKRL